ncbi:SIR2 family protein [Arthrobacter sp. zg-ZUI100]|uniref:SIR2 family protein n=1 Tax=Arthrobacter jiangjiafuii TaxID=2817475 RepID=UPI001AEDF6DD|nr:SIR2 family protein [Arthrobacter jiangjiafuii]MBP3035076.1 SIR2 family protein [Arthrobacter jiangjiafuii]
MSNSTDQLRSLLVSSKTLPVLFVGSGLSRRYIDSPDWEGLLSQLAGLTGRPLSYYEGKVGGYDPDMKLPAIASRIAADFYDTWFFEDGYRESRDKYEQSIAVEADPLKVETAKYINSLKLTQRDGLISELEKLASVRAHAVITTNFDSVLEDALPDMEVYVGQQTVLFSATQSVGEIYKIHGSASDPASLVLTAEDYEAYWDRNPYLIAKMLTLFVEHPVIFIGYSLRDTHIQRLLSNLVNCLTEEQLETLNDRLIFVGRPSPTRGEGLARSTITVAKHTFGVQEIGLEDFGELYDMLAELPQHFPVKLLRQLSESVYQLAYSTEPTGRVYVLPFDEETQSDSVEVVVGVGTMERLGEMGYSAYSRTNLFRDMLQGKKDHNVTNMLERLIPSIFKTAKYSPIWYPLRLADNEDVVVDRDVLPLRALQLMEGVTPLTPYPSRRPSRWQEMTFEELSAEHPDLRTNLGIDCTYGVSDVVALRDYLLGELDGATAVTTPIAKLCCKFDQLVYGEGFSGNGSELREALGIHF